MLIGLAGLDVRTEIPGWWTTHYFVFTWRETVSFYMVWSRPTSMN
jgi:hypothetical protein